MNGQPALEVRQDGTEKSIDTSLRGSAPPTVEGATLSTVPHGRAEGAGEWRGIMLLAQIAATWLRLRSFPEVRRRSVRKKMILVKFLGTAWIVGEKRSAFRSLPAASYTQQPYRSGLCRAALLPYVLLLLSGGKWERSRHGRHNHSSPKDKRFCLFFFNYSFFFSL